MITVSPSLLAADFANLQSEVTRVAEGGAEYLHLDVMDGAFVPNISFGAPVISALRKHSKLVFDVHLMINDPERYLNDFAKAGADIITIHYESCKDSVKTLRLIREMNIKAAIAISPATPANVLFPLLGEVDMVLVMTVVPGFGGQKLIPETLQKVKELRRVIDEKGLKIDIQVDGGITPENVGDTTAAGANVIVAGSAIFKAADPSQVITDMRKSADLHPYKA